MMRLLGTGRRQFGVRTPLGAVFAGVLVVILGGWSERSATPPAISLVEGFGAAEVSESPRIQLDFPRLEWRFVDAEGADFALESFRVIPRTEHLAGVPAGIGWQGLAGIFRETLVPRAPERLTWH